jgi:hypothetical protein
MARPKGPPIETRRETPPGLPQVAVRPGRLREVDLVARKHELTREEAIDWLLESALWNWQHGSLPGPRRMLKGGS